MDEIVYYKPLQKAQITKIVDLLQADLQKRLSDKQLTLEITEAAKKFIVERGYDPIYGARPLKRYMQHSIETLLARLMIAQDPAPNTHLLADVENGELTVKIK